MNPHLLFIRAFLISTAVASGFAGMRETLAAWYFYPCYDRCALIGPLIFCMGMLVTLGIFEKMPARIKCAFLGEEKNIRLKMLIRTLEVSCLVVVGYFVSWHGGLLLAETLATTNQYEFAESVYKRVPDIFHLKGLNSISASWNIFGDKCYSHWDSRHELIVERTYGINSLQVAHYCFMKAETRKMLALQQYYENDVYGGNKAKEEAMEFYSQALKIFEINSKKEESFKVAASAAFARSLNTRSIKRAGDKSHFSGPRFSQQDIEEITAELDTGIKLLRNGIRRNSFEPSPPPILIDLLRPLPSDCTRYYLLTPAFEDLISIAKILGHTEEAYYLEQVQIMLHYRD